MYCPHCGSELEKENQKFCQNCGTRLKILDNLHLSKWEVEVSDKEKLGSEIEVGEFSTSAPKMKKGAGKYSKQCLGLAIISNVFISVSISILSILLRRLSNFILYGDSYFPSTQSSRVLIRTILYLIIIAVNITGLILGIGSRSLSKKAAKLEPENNLEKAGSVIAVLGIVFNTILMVIFIGSFIFSLVFFP